MSDSYSVSSRVSSLIYFHIQNNHKFFHKPSEFLLCCLRWLLRITISSLLDFSLCVRICVRQLCWCVRYQLYVRVHVCAYDACVWKQNETVQQTCEKSYEHTRSTANYLRPRSKFSKVSIVCNKWSQCWLLINLIPLHLQNFTRGVSRSRSPWKFSKASKCNVKWLESWLLRNLIRWFCETAHKEYLKSLEATKISRAGSLSKKADELSGTYSYIYAYIYICIYMCIYAYISRARSISKKADELWSTYSHVCVYTSVYVYTYIYTYAQSDWSLGYTVSSSTFETWKNIACSICIFTWIHVCIHCTIHIYIYICIRARYLYSYIRICSQNTHYVRVQILMNEYTYE